MPSEDRGTASTPEAAAHSRGSLLLEFIKATKIPLIVGILAAAGLVALFIYGIPARELGLLALTSIFVGPVVSAYGLLWAWFTERRESVPLMVRDPDHDRIGLKMLSPNEWAAAEIDGDGLSKRDGMFTGKTVHIAEGHEWEERERIDRDAGRVEEVPVRVLSGTWELELSYQEFVEDREALKLWKEEIVPLARAGLKERAGSDVRVMKKTDRLGHALVAGAEQDQFLATDADPFGWSLDEDDGLPGDFTDADDDAAEGVEDDPESRGTDLADLFDDVADESDANQPAAADGGEI